MFSIGFVLFFGGKSLWYSLVEEQFAMEHHPFLRGKSTINIYKWSFSIEMFETRGYESYLVGGLELFLNVSIYWE